MRLCGVGVGRIWLKYTFQTWIGEAGGIRGRPPPQSPPFYDAPATHRIATRTLEAPQRHLESHHLSTTMWHLERSDVPHLQVAIPNPMIPNTSKKHLPWYLPPHIIFPPQNLNNITPIHLPSPISCLPILWPLCRVVQNAHVLPSPVPHLGYLLVQRLQRTVDSTIAARRRSTDAPIPKLRPITCRGVSKNPGPKWRKPEDQKPTRWFLGVYIYIYTWYNSKSMIIHLIAEDASSCKFWWVIAPERYLTTLNGF